MTTHQLGSALALLVTLFFWPSGKNADDDASKVRTVQC